MGKTDKRRPQFVSDTVMEQNWNHATAYKCPSCGWYGAYPDIIGHIPLYSLACPDCGATIPFTEDTDGT